ncbi:MAG: hypothetical protein EPN38_02110 [Rhodanobacteraceae bacterium]|nr:MAG: hypothetical protein EPN38_02110 [Rhodanobacteraceae bacterium]
MNTAARLIPLPPHTMQPGLHAGFWLRVAAYLVDGLILAAALALAYFALDGTAESWPWVPRLGWPLLGARPSLWLLMVLVPWVYYAAFEASALQATPGKLVLGLCVVDDYGQRVGFARASGRFFGKIVSGLVLDAGYLVAAWTPRKQALHDLMAGCCVVRRTGLAAWRQAAAAAPAPAALLSPRGGMPGWALALVVLGACAFLLLPFAAMLAALAIPAYQQHVVRGEVAEGAVATARARALVAEYIGQRGALPDDNRALGLPRPDAIQARYVSSVGVMAGKVVVTYGNAADARISGGHVVFSPVGNAARLQWRCSSPDIRTTYLPADCR